MELGPQNHNGDGLLGRNSIIVVYLDPLGIVKPESLSGLGVRYVDGVCLCGFYELLGRPQPLSQARAPDPKCKALVPEPSLQN